MLCGRVLQRGRGAEVQRSRGVVFPVCAVVVSVFMQRAEGSCGRFCLFAENKEIHGVQGLLQGCLCTVLALEQCRDMHNLCDKNTI